MAKQRKKVMPKTKSFRRTETGRTSRARIDRAEAPTQEAMLAAAARSRQYEAGNMDWLGGDGMDFGGEGMDDNYGTFHGTGEGERSGLPHSGAAPATAAAVRAARVERTKLTHSTRVAREFDALVEPFLSATRTKLPSVAAWSNLSCGCHQDQLRGLRAPTSRLQVRVLDFDAIHSVDVYSCETHIRTVLITAGIFPATPARPNTGFTFALLRFFRALQGQTRLGSSHFVNALLDIYQPTIPSKDRYRKKFRAAFAWYKALERRCDQLILGLREPTDAAFGRPTLHHDELVLSAEDFAKRCPGCFGHLLETSESMPSATATTTEPQSTASLAPAAERMRRLHNPQVIICLDGNFQHKRWRKAEAVVLSQVPPSFFLSASQLETAEVEFRRAAEDDGPATGCGAYVKAALEGPGSEKASMAAFDISGVVGMTCRHGIPLVLVDVEDTGEAHHYAYALIRGLLASCGSRLQSLGICYDIGCKLAVSPRMASSLATHFPDVKIHYAVSIFHVYGHDVDCQTKFSPRRCPGFGWTDGKALERLWSSLRDLISITRPMSRLLKTERQAMVDVEADIRSTLLALDVNRVLRDAEAAVDGCSEEAITTDSGSVVEAALPTEKPVDSTPALEGVLPSALHDLLKPLGALVDSRRRIAFERQRVNRKAQQRLNRLLNDPAVAVENEAAEADGVAQGPEEDDTAADVQRATRARQLAFRGPANMLKYLATREKIAGEALAAAALALHKPLVQWHSITDQMASRRALPSNGILVRQTVSKSACTATAKKMLPEFNKVVDQYNSIVAECSRMKDDMMKLRPAQPGAPDQSFVSSAAESDTLDLHYAQAQNQAGTTRSILASASYQRHFVKLAEYEPPLAAERISAARLTDRQNLDRLAVLVDPSDLSFQPWALSPVLASAMDHLERVTRLVEEAERLVCEATDAAGWLSRCMEDLLLRRQEESDPGRAAFLRRKLRMAAKTGKILATLKKIENSDEDRDEEGPDLLQAAVRTGAAADDAEEEAEDDDGDGDEEKVPSDHGSSGSEASEVGDLQWDAEEGGDELDEPVAGSVATTASREATHGVANGFARVRPSDVGGDGVGSRHTQGRTPDVVLGGAGRIVRHVAGSGVLRRSELGSMMGGLIEVDMSDHLVALRGPSRQGLTREGIAGPGTGRDAGTSCELGPQGLRATAGGAVSEGAERQSNAIGSQARTPQSAKLLADVQQECKLLLLLVVLGDERLEVDAAQSWKSGGSAMTPTPGYLIPTFEPADLNIAQSVPVIPSGDSDSEDTAEEKEKIRLRWNARMKAASKRKRDETAFTPASPLGPSFDMYMLTKEDLAIPPCKAPRVRRQVDSLGPRWFNKRPKTAMDGTVPDELINEHFPEDSTLYYGMHSEGSLNAGSDGDSEWSSPNSSPRRASSPVPQLHDPDCPPRFKRANDLADRVYLPGERVAAHVAARQHRRAQKDVVKNHEQKKADEAKEKVAA
ncbi:hypothetical protein V8E36_009142 [Tilletia maclaganii]